MDNKPMLVYEETGVQVPQKFYGKKDGYKSASIPGDLPNYAFLIFDVRLTTFLTHLEKTQWLQTCAHSSACQV
jgi:hypothetical protein